MCYTEELFVYDEMKECHYFNTGNSVNKLIITGDDFDNMEFVFHTNATDREVFRISVLTLRNLLSRSLTKQGLPKNIRRIGVKNKSAVKKRYRKYKIKNILIKLANIIKPQ